MTEPFETETRWLVRDTADDRCLRLGMVRRGSRTRPAAVFVPIAKAKPFGSAKEAATAALLAPADRFETLEFVEQKVERRSAARVSESVPRPASPRNFGVVPSSWIAATNTMSAPDLIDTLRVVESRGVDPREIPAVVHIFEEVMGQAPRMR